MISRSPQSHGGEDRTADEQRDGIDRQVTGDPRQEGAPSRIKVTGRTNGPSTRPGVFWLPQHDSSSQVLHRQRNQAGGEHSTEQHCTAQRDGVGKTSRDAIGNGSPRQPLSRTAANDEPCWSKAGVRRLTGSSEQHECAFAGSNQTGTCQLGRSIRSIDHAAMPHLPNLAEAKRTRCRVVRTSRAGHT